MLRVLDFEEVPRRKRLQMMRRRQVNEEIKKKGFKKEDAIERAKCGNAIHEIAKNMR